MRTASPEAVQPGWARGVLATLLAAGFVALALVVELAGSLPGDERTLEALYDTFGTELDDLMVGIGAASDSIPIVATWVVVVAVLWRTDHRDAYIFLVVVVSVMIGNRLLKELFARPRPDIRPSPESLSTFSFPSGHASNTAAIVAGLVLVTAGVSRRRVVVVGTLGVLLVGFSRLAIGVHYPSDVLAGWLWVTAWATGLMALRQARVRGARADSGVTTDGSGPVSDVSRRAGRTQP